MINKEEINRKNTIRTTENLYWESDKKYIQTKRRTDRLKKEIIKIFFYLQRLHSISVPKNEQKLKLIRFDAKSVNNLSTFIRNTIFSLEHINHRIINFIRFLNPLKKWREKYWKSSIWLSFSFFSQQDILSIFKRNLGWPRRERNTKLLNKER